MHRLLYHITLLNAYLYALHTQYMYLCIVCIIFITCINEYVYRYMYMYVYMCMYMFVYMYMYMYMYMYVYMYLYTGAPNIYIQIYTVFAL